jgi:hypothetical protein
MDLIKEYDIYCHFCGIGKKTVKASSYEEAKRLIMSDESVHFDEIIQLTKPCLIDKTISEKHSQDLDKHTRDDIEYKNWGSE